MKYLLKSTLSMKEYNYKNWWIDTDLIRDIFLESPDINTALKEYKTIAAEKYGVEISNNALKNKSPMYKDTAAGPEQIGFVITGKTEFDRGNYTGYTTQYIDIWLEILTITETIF